MEADNNGVIRDDKGRFGKGNPGKPKGAVTLTSIKVKESIVNFLEDNIDAVQASFDKLGPAQKLKFIAEILPYATPKLSSIQSENETHISGGINISWQEPPVRNTGDKGSD